MSAEAEIDSVRRDGDGVRCTVRLGSRRYDVGVSDAAAVELGPLVSVEELVRESFAFLLEREPPDSIMRSFDLPVITRYFPEYPREIRRRLQRA